MTATKAALFFSNVDNVANIIVSFDCIHSQSVSKLWGKRNAEDSDFVELLQISNLLKSTVWVHLNSSGFLLAFTSVCFFSNLCTHSNLQ